MSLVRIVSPGNLFHHIETCSQLAHASALPSKIAPSHGFVLDFGLDDLNTSQCQM